jgi:hypothetical protein
LPVCRPRELVLPTETGKVIGLAGVRRSGKTFLFFDAIRREAEQGVDRRRIVYLMALGQMRWPEARGRLLYHEYAPGVERTFPTAEPAWRFLIGD